MSEIETTDAYRDLGYLPKDEIDSTFKSVQKAVEKMNTSQDERRMRNFALVKELDPTITDEGQGTVSLKILGRQIDFHLPSNTFYLHSKGEYGYGIDKQVASIKDYLARNPTPLV